MPRRRNGSPLQYSCLENPMHRGAWQASVHRAAKSQTQLKPLSICPKNGASQVSLVVKNLPCNARDMRDSSSILGQQDLMEKATATHSSILAWRIPWTEESGGLQSIGSYRVWQDWSDLDAHMHTKNNFRSPTLCFCTTFPSTQPAASVFFLG